VISSEPGAIVTVPEDRQLLARRTLKVLVLSQALGSAGFASSVAVGALVAKDLLGGDTFAGASGATVTIGGAFASLTLAGVMAARGRRPGLLLGYGVASIGALIIVLGAQQRWFPVFIVGSFLFGQAQGANQLARFAAADLAPDDQRGTYIAQLMFASTFGGVLGPLMVGVSERVGTALGLWELTGPYIVAIGFFGLSALNTWLRLRPDPLVVAGGLEPGRGVRLPPVRAALATVRSIPAARLAMGTVVLGHVVMVAVMTMTPVHMKDHGHSVSLSGAVIALHISGMYALSPLVGRWSDRAGRVPVLMTGAMVLLGATVVTAAAGHEPALLFAGLLLLGLGWSCTMVSGSAMLSESVPAASRVAVQGTSDLIMGLCGAMAAFGSGFVKRAWGFHVLADAGAIAAFALGLVLLRRLRAGAGLPAIARAEQSR
jgi:MFS family permease